MSASEPPPPQRGQTAAVRGRDDSPAQAEVEAQPTTLRQRDLRVPACQACRNDLRAGRPPDALRDDGRVWFETGSLWARTGFGVFEPDLAERLLRGERTRPG